MYAVTCKGPKGCQHAERQHARAKSSDSMLKDIMRELVSLLPGTGVLHASRTSADNVSRHPTMLS